MSHNTCRGQTSKCVSRDKDVKLANISIMIFFVVSCFILVIYKVQCIRVLFFQAAEKYKVKD